MAFLKPANKALQEVTTLVLSIGTMKKAVIKAGGKQYVVAEGDELNIDFVKDAGKTLTFPVLLTTDGEKTSVGKPEVKDAKVTAKVIDPHVRAEKVTAIRYKAKKRVNKVRGHRQDLTKIKISKIA